MSGFKMTPEERRISHQKAVARYIASAKGKASRAAWFLTPAGVESVRATNERYHAKQKAELIHRQAEEQENG